MKNTIAERIYDFLKDFPPFGSLERNQLMTICEQVKVGYYEKGSSVLPRMKIYMIHFTW